MNFSSKKTLRKIILILALVLLVPALSFGSGQLEYITDPLNLLSYEDHQILSDEAARLSEMYGCDIAVFAYDDTDGRSTEDYTRYIFDEYEMGYGSERSILFLFINLEEREYELFSRGYGDAVFSDSVKDIIMDEYVLPSLSEDNYNDAFTGYLKGAEKYLSLAAEGQFFEEEANGEGDKLPLAAKLAIVIIIPLIIATIVTLIWKGKMKTAVAAKEAGSYIPKGGFRLTKETDSFMYRTEERRVKQKATGGGSKSGSSGKSGKF